MTSLIVSLNLAGCLLSFIGAGFVIICYLLLPMKRHFRHVLILNLAVADCLNALDMTISGFYLVPGKIELKAGPACTANGFIAQLTVQATDCSIFTIAVITVYTITRSRNLNPLKSRWTWTTILLVTAGTWILPLVTSFLALGKNWCWLVEDPSWVRYALTHGWRLVFILVEIILYTYLHLYLRNHYQQLSAIIASQGTAHITIDVNVAARFAPIINPVSQTPQPSIGSAEKLKISWKKIFSRHQTDPSNNTGLEKHHPRHKSIQKVLLLNAYPLGYIILWIPGIANRLVEASGHSSKITQTLQASTQFVGLANALTYGWNEGIAQQLKDKYGWKPRK
ncbi:hypothetical protein BDQ12DRAFT_668092 [Crucibulum laeve]|uniref:G-protein coupled receptors family 1 profile domain-containing protein n=1 Tax=Crucibulum laeve TaxID=68775 RepID=A0A5C3LUD4_9AGAR|nr:hypothetical protein BDQ12DRAFT_668092 [Crucibulum laeve]